MKSPFVRVVSIVSSALPWQLASCFFAPTTPPAQHTELSSQLHLCCNSELTYGRASKEAAAPRVHMCRSASPQAVGKLGRGLWPASVSLTPFIPGFHTNIIIFSIYRDPKTVGRFHLRWASLRSIMTGGLPVHTVTPPGHQVAPVATWARCGSPLQTTLCYPDIQWKPPLLLSALES